ncbi:MAG TPA: hypothetical protein VEB63_03810 [Chitinophagaceae bacterium]|nr:hypothetical protein [Chitinophagaceae bacterium]
MADHPLISVCREIRETPDITEELRRICDYVINGWRSSRPLLIEEIGRKLELPVSKQHNIELLLGYIELCLRKNAPSEQENMLWNFSRNFSG